MSYDIDELKKSMVKIINPDTQNTTNTAGSGFIIRSDGYFITCHHVIYRLSSLKVEYQGQVYDDVQWCEALSNPDVDIAILKISLSGAKAVPIINPQDVSTSVTVYGFPQERASNFPDGFDFPAQNIRKSASVKTLSTYKYKDITLTNSWNKLPEPTSTFEAYRINAPVDSGTSGGPVLADNLSGVVGVIQSSNSNESYVIRWDNITESLKKLELDFNMVSKKQKEPIQILIELLQLSNLAIFSERRGLCETIGIQPGKLSFLTLTSDDSFTTELVNYLHRVGRKQALCKLCQQLESVFPEGEQTDDLAFVKASLNCN
ncbi:hypothetical protein WA1_25380 [Scytonema hofmannii PCC 7110]|uniref:Serine protease n=1 Tax=Scytonema hofmannii PCC 7110 TaxID=128403 RepID=A0A139X8B4_9CYAN|nr:serine protease [Scytonema hofmannii]KYC40949.1 hypothetical protein WA1_25380 [Scytonema hofmannii PCC 7110]